MSVRVPLSSIDENLALRIDKDLIVVPSVDGSRPNQAQPKNIHFYLADGSGNVNLPYTYCCDLFGKRMNDEERLKHIGEYEFKATFREEQIGIVEEAIVQLENHRTTSLCVPPGWGKTIMGMYLAVSTGLVVAIIVPAMSLVKQWYKTVEICYPELIPNTLVMGKLKKDNSRDDIISDIKIIICLDQRVRKLRPSILDMVGTLILDEAHLLPTRDRVDILLAFRPAYIIAETATMERNDGQHSMIEAMVGKHLVYRAPIRPFLLMKLETEIRVQESFSPQGLDYTQLVRDLSECEEMNRLVIDIINSNPRHKFMILSKLTCHAESLSSSLCSEGISSDTMCGDKNNYTDSRVLVGTIKKIGTGFDEENCCLEFLGEKSNVLILYHSVKSWQSFIQYTGRVCRSSNPYVIWMNGKNRVVRKHLDGLSECIVKNMGTVVPMSRRDLTLPPHPSD
jgi:hypothetical protein